MKIGDKVEIIKIGHPARGGVGYIVEISPPRPNSMSYPRDYPVYGVALAVKGWPVYILQRDGIELIEDVPIEIGRPKVEQILDEVEARGCPMRFDFIETWQDDEGTILERLKES